MISLTSTLGSFSSVDESGSNKQDDAGLFSDLSLGSPTRGKKSPPATHQNFPALQQHYLDYDLSIDLSTHVTNFQSHNSNAAAPCNQSNPDSNSLSDDEGVDVFDADDFGTMSPEMRRLRRFHLKYIPHRANDVAFTDDVLTRYQGREPELFQCLVRRYGPEPPEDYDGYNPVYLSRLQRFHDRYVPAKKSRQSTVAVLRRYEGREAELFRKLAARYGPEPALPQDDDVDFDL